MNIRDIKWPVYAIGGDTCTHTEYNVLYADYLGKSYIIDNKNLRGDTLGSRRLKIPQNELYTFTRTMFMLSELIEITRNKIVHDRWFIDNEGKLFIYHKKKICKLLWGKIVSVEQYENFAVLGVKGLVNTFELPNNYWNRVKNNKENYLGLLKIDDYYIIYDIMDHKIKDTWRKV